MKTKNGKELVGKHMNGNTCLAIYKVVKGVVRTLWVAILSCFSNGWDNNKGWNDDEGWTND